MAFGVGVAAGVGVATGFAVGVAAPRETVPGTSRSPTATVIDAFVRAVIKNEYVPASAAAEMRER